MKTYKVKTIEYVENEKIHYVVATSKAEARKCIKSPAFETPNSYVSDSEPDNYIGTDIRKTKILEVVELD